MSDHLTAKQRAFVDSYVLHRNGSKAARLAGYAPACAGAQSAENLQKPYIRAEIDARLAAAHLDAVSALALLSRQAQGDLSDFYDLSDDGQPVLNLAKADEAGVMSLVEKFIRDPRTGKAVDVILKDSMPAISLIAKHLRIAADRADLLEDSSRLSSGDQAAVARSILARLPPGSAAEVIENAAADRRINTASDAELTAEIATNPEVQAQVLRFLGLDLSP